jgi:hypothetical protein
VDHLSDGSRGVWALIIVFRPVVKLTGPVYPRPFPRVPAPLNPVALANFFEKDRR